MKTEAEIGMVWLRISEAKAPGTVSPPAGLWDLLKVLKHAPSSEPCNWVNRILTKTFDSHSFIKQLLLRGYYMLSTVRVTEDAAVSKMKEKNIPLMRLTCKEEKIDSKQTNTYIIYTVLSVMKRNKTE